MEAKEKRTWVEPESDDEETASNEETGNQEEEVCCDSTTEAEMADSKMNFQMRKQKKTLHQMKILPLFLLQTASSTLMPKKARRQKTRLQQNQRFSFDPFSLDEDDSAAFGLEDEAEKPTEKTAENVNAEPEEDDSLTINETSEELTEEAEQKNTDDCEEAEEDEDDEDEDAEAILID